MFGSAIEERCTEKSDIDIAIINKDSVQTLCKNKDFSKFMELLYSAGMEQEYGRLYFKSMDEIKEKQNKVKE